jgi:hypothetical protein
MSAPRRAVNHPSFTAVRVKSPCRVESRRPSASCAVRTPAVVRCRTRKCSQNRTGHGARCYQSLPYSHHELRPCQYHIRRAQLGRHIYGVCVDRRLVSKILNSGAILFCVSSALLCLLCYACSVMPTLFCSTLFCPTLLHVHICEPRAVCTCFHVSNCPIVFAAYTLASCCAFSAQVRFYFRQMASPFSFAVMVGFGVMSTHGYVR